MRSDIGIVPAGEGHAADRVQLIEYLASDTFVQVECSGDAAGAGTLVVRAPGNAGVREDKDVALRFDPDAAHRFGAAGAAMREA